MKNTIKIKFYTLFVTALAMQLLAVAQPTTPANKLFNEYAYSPAIEKYKKAIKKDPESHEAWSNLAESYRINNFYSEAEDCYSHIASLKKCSNDQKLSYALVLMSNKKYADAKKWLQNYNEATNSTDKRAINLISGIDNLNQLHRDSGYYTVEKLNINSENSDFGTALYKDGFVFSSSRKNISMVKRTHSWTDKPFISMYYTKGNNNNFQEPEMFAKAMQTRYNNGPVCFNSNGTEMYVTTNDNAMPGIPHTKMKTVRLSIFKCVLKNNSWGNAESFEFNSSEYSCAHPALNNDGSRLYFSSDMPGGLGGMDIYVCKKEGDKWSRPENLGNKINTSGNEVFTTIDSEGKIYFASNGLPGIGGLDIFSMKCSKDKYSEPKNIGAPVNSSFDDFAYTYDSKNNSGYFSSNRELKTDDDIYTFKINGLRLEGLVYDEGTGYPIDIVDVKIKKNGIEEENITTGLIGEFERIVDFNTVYNFLASKDPYIANSASLNTAGAQPGSLLHIEIPMANHFAVAIEGSVREKETQNPMNGVAIELMNMKTGKLETGISSSTGKYLFNNLDTGTVYKVIAGNKNCYTQTELKSTKGINENTLFHADFDLLPCEGDIIVIENIYYNLDKHNIRTDAEEPLNKVLTLLNKNPDISILLRSHTDSRANDAYNLALSQRRATAAVEYLVKHGIRKNRLQAKGFGETLLVNKCGNEVYCTEEEHQLNRRTEFQILKSVANNK